MTAVASNTMDINNEARVAAADPVDPDTANNFATASINVLPVADVVVFKQVAPTTVNAGEQLVYTLTVANFGPSIARNVVVEDVLPQEVSIVAGGLQVVAGPPSCATTQSSAGNQVVTCNLGDVATSAWTGGHHRHSCALDADAPVGVLYNQATVRTDSVDPNNSNNISGVDVTVAKAGADVSIRKSADPTTVVAGAGYTYTLVVNNNGPTTAENVVVADVLPLGVAIVDGGLNTTAVHARRPRAWRTTSK